MNKRILQVFYGTDALPYKDKERTVHFPIVGNAIQNANNTTQIKFYFDRLIEENEQTTFVAVSKLPNGKIGSKILETYDDEELGEQYALLDLDSFYTQYKGDVFISLQGYQGGVRVEQDEQGIYQIYGTPVIAATGSIKLAINYAPSFVGSGETENVTLQQVLGELSTKLGVRQETLHVEELPTVGNPDIWYVINDDEDDPNKQNIYIWNATTQSYVWVGDNTLDLGSYYTQEEGEQFEEEIDQRITNVENTFNGSPKGVYATLEDLQTAFPTGTTGIYVVSGGTYAGHWFYWNGSAWTDGGVYQAALGIDNHFSDSSTNPIQNAILTKEIGRTNLLFEAGTYNANATKAVDNTTGRLISPYLAKENDCLINGLTNEGYIFNICKLHISNGSFVVDSWTTRINWSRVYLEPGVYYLFTFRSVPQSTADDAFLRNLENKIYIKTTNHEFEEDLVKIMKNGLSVIFDGTEEWNVGGSQSLNGLYNFYTFSRKLTPKMKYVESGYVPEAMITNERTLTNGVVMTRQYVSAGNTPFFCCGYNQDGSFWIRTNVVTNVSDLVTYLTNNNMIVFYKPNEETINKIERYNQKPKPVIFDTDWWTDVDDAMAIRVLLWAEREGMLDILGLSVNAVNDNTAKSLSRFLDYEGRGGFPFMVTNTPTDFGGNPSYFQTIIDNWNWGLYQANSDVPFRDAKTYYKKCLESLPQGEKATIICVGYLNNISEFLSATVADDGFDGIDLFSKKVERIFIMGGNYPNGSENNFNRSALARSSAYNVVTNIPSNVPVIFLGFEIGQPVLCGGTIKDTLGTDDLIYKCLLAHGGSTEANNGRSAWDPMTVMLAVLHETLYDDWEAGYRLIRGTNVVDPSTGANTFTTNSTGHHYYVLKKFPDNWYKYQINKVLEKIAWKTRTLGEKQINN